MLRPGSILLLVAVAASAAMAQDSGTQVTVTAPTTPPAAPPASMVVEPVGMMIAACDANNDAIVTHEEMTQCVARSFAAIDMDHKGSIGFIDYSDWARIYLGDPNAAPGPFEMDTDNDNRITLAEMEAKFDAIFARLDRDHDGKLTRAELLTIRANPGGYWQDDHKHKKR
jgi:Ca2+-binding EF-hand superfamily protein